MNYCFVNEQGEMLCIPPYDREPIEGEIKVPLDGYYEVFNEQHYSEARYDFELSAWAGVGEPVPIPNPSITEEQKAIDMMKYLMQSDEFLLSVGITPIGTTV